MKGIVTVLGRDQKGIIAKVCTYLSNEGVNILDISQTIVQGFFNMIMIVDLTGQETRFFEMASRLTEIGNSMEIQVRLQREDIFNSMHRL